MSLHVWLNPAISEYTYAYTYLMPRRTIYVSENDQELFERAAQEPGGLSPTVAIALNEYMARAVLRNEGMEVIDLTIDDNGVSHKVRFTGRKLLRLEEKVANGVRVRFAYLTKQNRYAIHEKIIADPADWEGQGERLWRDPLTWTHSFWIRSNRTLEVYDTLDQLREKDPDLADRVAAAQKTPPLEELDI